MPPTFRMLPTWLTDCVTSDLSRAVRYTLLWGLEGVVLRTVGTLRNRVPFVNEQQIRARLQDASLPVLAVDPGLFEGPVDDRAAWLNDLQLLDETAAFCRRIGCGMILAGALGSGGHPGDAEARALALRQAGQVATRQGVALALRNEADSSSAGGLELDGLLERIGLPAVQAAWSPADAVEAGMDPAEGLRALLESGRLAFVVVRDGAMNGARWAQAIPGEGMVGWEDQLGLLAASGFEGPLCLDIRGDSPARNGLAYASALIALGRKAASGEDLR